MKHYKKNIKNVKNIILQYLLKNFELEECEKKRLLYRSENFKLLIKGNGYKTTSCVILKSPIKIFKKVFERKPTLVIKKNKNLRYFYMAFVHEYVHLLSTTLFYEEKGCCYKSGVLKYIYNNNLELVRIVGEESLNETLTDIISKYLLEKCLFLNDYIIKDEECEKNVYIKYGNDFELIMLNFFKNKL